jgi:hypothetical protein
MKIISWQAQAPENYAPQFHELHHQAYSQFNDQSYSTYHPPLQKSQATPYPQSNSDVQAQMLKLLGEINQKLTQTINSHSEFIAKIEAHKEEPSPIYWPPQQQYQEEPSLLSDSKMLNLMREIEKTNQIMKSGQEQYTPQFFAEIDAKIEAHVEQIINYLNREEEELQSKPVANLDRHYMVDESTSYHEQVITTLKNEEVVETHVKNRKEEQIEAPKALHRAKGEEMSTEAPSSSILILKMPYEPRAPIPGNLKFLFLETDNTLPVIIAYDLTRGEESGLLGLL